MEQTKEQILNGLYALRAGLSVISEEYDKIKALKIERVKDFVAVGSKLQPYYYRIIKNSYSISSLRPYWDNFIQLMLSHNYEWNNILLDIYGEEFKQKDYNKRIAIRDNFFSKEFSSDEYKDIGLEEEIKIHKILFPYQNESWGDYFAENSCDCTKRAMEGYILALWLKSGGCQESLNAKIISQRSKLFGGKKLLAELEQMQKELPAIQRELQVVESNDVPQQIKEIKDNATVYYNALQVEFSPFLDVRDWQYLDLVIYYFETRRAETVKEALQLVDREMQTRRIEQLIIAATSQICNTLALGFAMLQNTMLSCFNALSAQIAQSNMVISAQLNVLTNATNMGNALKAKANVTSERLMNEVKQIICD